MTRRPPPHVASTVVSAAHALPTSAVEEALGPEMRMPVYAQRSPEWHALAPLDQHILAALWSYASPVGCPSCAPGRTDCPACFGMAGWTAWCSQDRLVTMTGATRRSVQKALRWLATKPAAGEASHQWLTRNVRWSDRGEQWATGYTLLLPGRAGACHAHALEVARGVASEPCTSCTDGACEMCQSRALFWPGDVFTKDGRTYVRTTRVPQRVIMSTQLAELRASCPSALRAMMLLSAHTGHGAQRAQHLGRDELGAWIDCCRRTTYTIATVLEKHGWGAMRQRARPGCKLWPAWSLRLFRADLQAHTPPASAAPRVVPMTTSTRTGAPPDELLDELRHQLPFLPLEEYSAQELWGLIESHGLAERCPDEAPPPSIGELALRVVRAFHGAWRPLALEHYDGLPRELEAARALIADHGTAPVFQALAYTVEHLRRSWRRGPPGEGFGAIALAMMREGLQLQSA